jgi:hypothetical protein
MVKKFEIMPIGIVEEVFGPGYERGNLAIKGRVQYRLVSHNGEVPLR